MITVHFSARCWCVFLCWKKNCSTLVCKSETPSLCVCMSRCVCMLCHFDSHSSAENRRLTHDMTQTSCSPTDKSTLSLCSLSSNYHAALSSSSVFLLVLASDAETPVFFCYMMDACISSVSFQHFLPSLGVKLQSNFSAVNTQAAGAL